MSCELELLGYFPGMLDDRGVIKIVWTFMYFGSHTLNFIGS